MSNTVDAQATLLDGETVPAADLRREVIGAMYSSAGVIRGLNVQALPTPDMRVRLPAGLCLVDDGAGGFYPLYLLTQTDLDIAPSSATLGRYDSVVAEVVDTGSEATLIRHFRVVTGTPQSSPTPPALPASDQPTGRTLRIGNVYVQPNAETNGKVRAQDVTFVAPTLSAVPRPVASSQIAQPSSYSSQGAVDFTSGQWPAVTFTVPPSGMVYVTIGAEVKNNNSVQSVVWATYRMSGGYTLSTRFEAGGLSAEGNSRVCASRRTLYTGLPPGASVTVTPQWDITSGSASTVTIWGGQLLVEPV